ncbi:MAG: cation diffusion facilitator family transporter [Muribaculaceae bacterium]|nr:cation diffusion facilitator family transporter [Muribaculaceae bacterium]
MKDHHLEDHDHHDHAVNNGHDGHHHHHHHHHTIDKSSLNTAFKLGIALNVGFVIVEAVFGFIYGSMGLLSDAGHNLSDVFALVLSMVAFKLMSKAPDERHTYGYRKFSIQASLINALLLFAAVGVILFESIEKLIHPTPVDGDAVAWVAAAGVLVNGITTWLFLKDKEKDLNVKGAYMHMLADTLVSIGVVIAGIVIHFTGWYFIDPIIGIGIALLIGWSTWSLLAESFRLSIDSVPEAIDMKQLEKALQGVEGVRGIHHLHVWALSTTENAMTVHAVIESTENIREIIAHMKSVALAAGISHSTIEVETKECACSDCGLIAND